MPSNNRNPKSKFVTPRSLGVDRFDARMDDPILGDGITPITRKEILVDRRRMRKMRVNQQSSLDSLASLMQLIKKLPDASQKSIIEQLKAARKKPGGSPSAALDDVIDDLPF